MKPTPVRPSSTFLSPVAPPGRAQARSAVVVLAFVGGLAVLPGRPALAQASPDARAHHRLVYHAGDERTYLLGGSTRRSDGYHYFDDVWAWDGADWTRVGSLPFPRSSHAVVYHDGRNSLVLFGGGSDGTFAADGALLEWSDDGWSVPGERDDGAAEPAMCYDRKRARIVLFGGWDAANRFSGATWEWTDDAFVEARTAGPSPRAGHALVYDPARERCLLFGGRSEDGYLSDTWEWDGSEWRRVDASGPSARWFFGAATDDANRRVVIFGGNGPEGDQGGPWALGDTWAWDGNAWELLSRSGPSPRGSPRLAFDGRAIVLFGGRVRTPEGFHDLGDTWQLDGRAWVRRR